MEADFPSPSHQMIHLPMPHVSLNDDSLTYELITVSRSFHHGNIEESLGFNIILEESSGVSRELIDENTTRLPVSFFLGNQQKSGNRLMKEFKWDLTNQRQNTNFLIKGVDEREEYKEDKEENPERDDQQYLREEQQVGFKAPKPIKPTSVKRPRLNKRSVQTDPSYRSRQGGPCFGVTKSMFGGLKQLSNTVKQILQGKGLSSYKEISNIIIERQSTAGLENLSKEKISKYHLNIKRRIYDSLNVLVAAGVLLRDRKKLSFNHRKPADTTKEVKALNLTLVEQMTQKLKELQTRNKDKKRMLQFMEKKYSAAQILAKRNAAKMKEQQQEKYESLIFIQGGEIDFEQDVVFQSENVLVIKVCNGGRISTGLDMISKYPQTLAGIQLDDQE